MKNILIISSHTDDAELGMGGTIHKLAQDNYIWHIVLSLAQISNPNHDTKVEWFKSNTNLGVKNKSTYEIPTREFYKHQSYIGEILTTAKRSFEPQIVFTHDSVDRHQDHKVTHEMTTRVFKNVDLYGYHLPWNSTEKKLNCISEISQDNLNAKIKSLSYYESQSKKPYFDPDYIRAMATISSIHFGLSERLQILNKILYL